RPRRHTCHRAFCCWLRTGPPNAREPDRSGQRAHPLPLNEDGCNCCRRLRYLRTYYSTLERDIRLHMPTDLRTGIVCCRKRLLQLRTASDCLGLPEVLRLRPVASPVRSKPAFEQRVILRSKLTDSG